MPIEQINIGLPDAGSGDTLFNAFTKTVNNFNYLDGKTLDNTLSNGATADTENDLVIYSPSLKLYGKDTSGGSGFEVSPNGDTAVKGSNGNLNILANAGGQIIFDPTDGITMQGNAGGISMRGSSKGIQLYGDGGGIYASGDVFGINLDGGTGGINFSGDSYSIANHPFNYVDDYSSNYTDRSLIDKGYLKASLTGLESINGGWRLIGRDPSYSPYPTTNSVDFSLWDSTSSYVTGNTGENAFIVGYKAIASQKNSVAIGEGASVRKAIFPSDYANSMVIGSYSNVYGDRSSIYGYGNILSGNNSTVLGVSNFVSGNTAYILGNSNSANTSSNSGNAVIIGNSNKADFETGATIGNSKYIFGAANSGYTQTFTIGYNNYNSGGTFSTAIGQGNRVLAQSALAFGTSLQVNTFGETVVGYLNTIITGSTNSFVATDPGFRVGIGSGSTRRDGLIVYKNGLITAPSASNTLISSGDAKSLITKEYLAVSSANSITLNTGSPVTVRDEWYGTLAQYQALSATTATTTDYNIQRAQNYGNTTINVSGLTTVNIAHGLGIVPSYVSINFDKQNSAALRDYTRTANSTNIVITFTTAPTETALRIDWDVRE